MKGFHKLCSEPTALEDKLHVPEAKKVDRGGGGAGGMRGSGPASPNA